MTSEKHLHSVSRAASKRLCIVRKSWRVFHDRSLLGSCFRGFGYGARLPTHTLNCGTVQSVMNWGVCLIVTLLIVDPWLYCVCCIRSGVIRCTLLRFSTWTVCASARYLRCSGRTLVHLCAASLQNLAVMQDFYSRLSVPLNRTGGFQEQDWWVSRAGPMLSYWSKLLYPVPTIVFYYFPFTLLSVYRSVFWGWGLRTDGVYVTLSALHCRHFLILLIIIIII